MSSHRKNNVSRHVSALATLAAVWLAPALAAAELTGPICEHPLSGGMRCAQLFGVVSVVYTVIAASYAFGALLILKPRFTGRRFTIAALLIAPLTWALTMASFSLCGLLGWLDYPHDASPFFYMSWPVALLTLVGTTLTLLALYRWGRAEAGEPAGGALDREAVDELL